MKNIDGCKVIIQEVLEESKNTYHVRVIIERQLTPKTSTLSIHEMNAVKGELGLPHHSNIYVKHLREREYMVYLPKKRQIRSNITSTLTSTLLESMSMEKLRSEIIRLQLENSRLRADMQNQLQVQMETAIFEPERVPTTTPPTVSPLFFPSHETCLKKKFPLVLMKDLMSSRKLYIQDICKIYDFTIVDFWSTKCVQCPSAMKILQVKALEFKNNARFGFVGINTDDENKSFSMIQSNDWMNTKQLYVNYNDKEMLKNFLGMKSLPHHVLLDKFGNVSQNGKTFTWKEVERLSVTRPTPNTPKLAEIRPVIRSQFDCIGELVPDFSVINVNTTNPQQLKFLLDKKFTIVVFWSNKCPSCPDAMERFTMQAAKYGLNDAVKFIGVNTDNLEDSKKIIQLQKWNSTKHYYLPFGDMEKMNHFLGMTDLPHHVVLNESGKVDLNGASFSWEKLDGLVKARCSKQLPITEAFEPQTEPLTLASKMVISEGSAFVLDEDF